MQVSSIGPLVIQTSKAVLDSMNAWCLEHHSASGLIQECLNSQLSVQQVDDQLANFCAQNNVKNGLLAGNSVGKNVVSFNYNYH